MNNASSTLLVLPRLLFYLISQQHDLLQAGKQRGLFKMFYQHTLCQNKADEASDRFAAT